MLDVSRHFFTVEEVKFFLDQMVALKLNVFHWHLTDDQGWRIESKLYPRLHEVGAWRVDYADYDWNHNRWWGRPAQQEGDTVSYGGYYTQDQIRELIAYAADRNIDILPEIDVPGHSQAIITSYPHVACHPGPYTVATGGAFKDNTLCPGKEVTYDFMADVLEEVMDLFPFEYLHIGGDECNKSAWSKDADCQHAIQSLGLKDEHELQSHFIQRMEKIIQAGGKKMIGWDEILEGGLADDAVVMSWRGEEGGIEAALAGHEIIMTPSKYTYLDLKQGHPDHEPNLGYARCLLSDCYAYDPIPSSLKKDADLVLGMQGNLWSESLPDLEKATYMTFPRLFAIAESAWTEPEFKDWTDFIDRLHPQLERLDKQGITYARSPFNVWIEHAGAGNGIIISLRTEGDVFEIFYTTDGSEPDRSSNLYTAPFMIEKSLQIRAVAYQGSRRVGERTEKMFHVHKGSAAVASMFEAKQGERIPAPELTDQNYGSNWSVDTMWQSHRTSALTVNLEWPTTQELNQVRLNFLQMAISGIYMPERIQVLSSDPEGDWKMISDTTLRRNAEVQGRYIQHVQLDLEPQITTALQVKLLPVNPIYPGHHLAGQRARIFLDEVIVY